MPITGLPVVLELSMCQLMKESDLVSYKISSNQAGFSTVVLQFAPITSPSSNHRGERFSYPPRHRKSPSQLRRDRQRQSYYTSSRQREDRQSTPCHVPKSRGTLPILNTCVNSPTPVLVDSGIQCVETSDTNVSEPGQHTTPPMEEASSVQSDSTVLPPDARTILHLSEQCKEPPCTDIPSFLTSSTPIAPRSVPFCEQPSTQPCFEDVGRNDSMHSESGALVFSCDADYQTAVQEAQSMSQRVLKRLIDPKRNDRFFRVMADTDSDGTPTLLGRTEDLLMTYFPKSKTVGQVYVLTKIQVSPKGLLLLERFRSFSGQSFDKEDSAFLSVLGKVKTFLVNQSQPQ